MIDGMRTIHPPTAAQDMLVVASVSGGKDSTAMILALLEAVERGELTMERLRFVFADTGWEHEDTYAYLVVACARGSESRSMSSRPRAEAWCPRCVRPPPPRTRPDALARIVASGPWGAAHRRPALQPAEDRRGSICATGSLRGAGDPGRGAVDHLVAIRGVRQARVAGRVGVLGVSQRAPRPLGSSWKRSPPPGSIGMFRWKE